MRDLKAESLQRISKYRCDYENDNVAKLSKTIPALMINMIDFLHKLDVSIKEEAVNLDKFNKEMNEIIKRMSVLDMKIKAINIKIADIEKKHRINAENREASLIEEMATLSKLRQIS